MAKKWSEPVQANRQFFVPRSNALGLLIILAGFLALMLVLAPWNPTRPVAAPPDGSDVGLRVTEVMSANRSAFPDETGSYPDWIELTNMGESALSLEGFSLSDRSDKIHFTFLGHILEAGERVIVFASDSTRNQPGKPYHAKFKLSSKGDTVYLYSPDGIVHDTINLPPMESDVSYALMEEGWAVTPLYSPGYENTEAGHLAFLEDRAVEPGALMINELVASNHTTQTDEDGDYSDWLEIYNSGETEMNLSGFGLSDDPGDPMQWTFAAGTTISPGGYLLVFASGKNRPGGGGLPPHTNFGLAAEGESVVLSDSIGRLLDRADYKDLQPDTSWGRRESEERGWSVFVQPTPGMPNTPDSELLMDQRVIANNPTGIFITEVLASNTKIASPDGLYSDYIELYNSSDTSVNLSGYGLSDSIGRPRKWQFPEVTILPRSYLVVWANGDNRKTEEAVYSSFSLSLAGETLVFSDPEGNILDRLHVPKLMPDVTYGRNQDQAGLFYYAVATPGAPNTESFSGFAEAPVLETPGGMYDNPTTVAITAPENAIVRYTLDGSDPTESSPLYEAPIEIPDTLVLRARAWAEGLHASEVVTQTYFISVYHALPVISLVTDPWNVLNEATGMLADGPNIDRETQDAPWFEDATYGQKNHFDGYIEMYEMNAEEDWAQVFSQGMSFHVMGQFSLDMPQKSFAVNAVGRYPPGLFNAKLFADRPHESYKNIVLRNGGQDGKYTRVLDGLQARLAEQAPGGTTVLTQAWRPVIVYLNGEYWGHYNLRERINRYFVAQHEGWIDPDAMDILESDGLGDSQVYWGSNADWVELIEYIEGKDYNLSNPVDLQYVADRVDIDNLLDYFIFEMYYGNTDPGNIRYYKKHEEGAKWKFILYDLDWGLFDSAYGGPGYVLREGGMGSYHINNALIRGVLSNPEMQDKFLKRCAEMFHTIFQPEYMIAEMDKMLAEIRPEMQMHFGRWAEEMHPKVSFDAPKNPEGALNYWSQRVSRAYNVIRKRPHIFWGMVQDTFGLSDPQMIEYFGERPALPEEE